MTGFLGLASNAGWFERDQLLLALAQRIKALLLLEDTLVVDDGAYHFVLGPDGAREQLLAPQQITWNREDMKFIGAQRVEDRFALRVDFRPLLKVAGLDGARGIEWGEHALVPKVKR